MSKIYQGIDLETIQFINNKNDIVIIFKNILNEKVIYNKKLILENVYHFEMFYNVDNEYPYTPYYLVELSVDEIKKPYKYSEKINKIISRISKQQGDKGQYFLMQTIGDLEISLICGNVIEISLC